MGVTNIAVGAAVGTSKAGIGIAGLGTFKPELIMKVTLRKLPAFVHSCWGIIVPHPCCHVWYHCGVWSCGVCSYSRVL